jgi:F-type H+-transporting ATPase subunit b
MRTFFSAIALLMLSAAPLLAAPQEGDAPPAFLTPEGGLMIWTLLIFIVLLFILSRFAFRPLLAAVEAREKSLQDAIDSARRDREEAAALLAAQRQQLEDARGEAQKLIVDGRQAGERMRADMIEQTRLEQQDMLERARREIGAERDRAIADLRREAVDLAILGAGRVIERNMDDESNRRLVESYLASLATDGAQR